MYLSFTVIFASKMLKTSTFFLHKIQIKFHKYLKAVLSYIIKHETVVYLFIYFGVVENSCNEFFRQSTALSRFNFNQNITTEFDEAKTIYPTYDH